VAVKYGPELAAFNAGLCIITTRQPVTDISDYEGTSVLRRELEQLSSDAGAELLRALGAKGNEEKLREASSEFRPRGIRIFASEESCSS
jgi:hypothetical protein